MLYGIVFPNVMIIFFFKLGKGLSEQAFNASVNESHPIIGDGK